VGRRARSKTFRGADVTPGIDPRVSGEENTRPVSMTSTDAESHHDSPVEVSVVFSTGYSDRNTDAFMHVKCVDGKGRFWVSGIDLSNFESLVGSKRAEQFRLFVGATIGTSLPEEPRARRFGSRLPRVLGIQR
jgi:hypothetical protein